MSLEERQNETKKKLANPLYVEVNKVNFQIRSRVWYAYVLILNDKLVSCGYQNKLNFNFNADLIFSDFFIFPFASPELAVAFIKKIKYYYECALG